MSIYVSLLTAGTNSHQETSENANAFGTDFVSQGVIGAITNTSGVAPSTGAFAVNAQSTPNMTVAVSAGVAYVTGTPASQNSQTLRVRNSASANVTISANSSGSTKYDWVYIKLDATKAANPAVDGDDVATLVTSRSSSSSSDNGTPPTYGYCVAVVTVANGASSITNANIADKRVLAASVQAATVTNAMLSTSAGEIGAAWPSWTPTWTNLTVGNSTVVANYIKIGKTVRFRLSLTLGSTGSFGSSPTFTLPVASVSSYVANMPIGSLILTNGTLKNFAPLTWASTTTANVTYTQADGTYLAVGGPISTVPFTWATGHQVLVCGEYEAA